MLLTPNKASAQSSHLPICSSSTRQQALDGNDEVVFATKQASSIQTRAIDIFDPALRHQIKKFIRINGPCALRFFVLIQDVLCRRQLRHVLIADIANRLCEIAQVVFLGEASQLRDVV